MTFLELNLPEFWDKASFSSYGVRVSFTGISARQMDLNQH